MRLISRARLKTFWEGYKSAKEIARRDLSSWFKVARRERWANFAELRQTFGSADQVGNCVVFDVGNNRFRLIGRVNYRRGIIDILSVMDHQEYDRRDWAEDCGCHRPPPKR